jgi:hypothetical protein
MDLLRGGNVHVRRQVESYLPPGEMLTTPSGDHESLYESIQQNAASVVGFYS